MTLMTPKPTFYLLHKAVIFVGARLCLLSAGPCYCRPLKHCPVARTGENTKAIPMAHVRLALPTAVLASLLIGKAGAEEPTRLLPARDVDIIYDVTLPSQPRIRERVRYRAAELLERVDGPHNSTTILDRRTHEMTIIDSANRTVLKLDLPQQPQEPGPKVTLKRGNESVVADCTASIGHGLKMWTRALFASPRTACCFVFSSTVRLFPRRVR
jgi:hypothetical protein